MMSLFDLALVILISGFAFFGLFFGFIHTLGSALGTLLGIWIAATYHQEALSAVHLSKTGVTGKIVSFIVLFLLTSRLLGLVFWLLEKLFGFVRFIPFIKTLNRLLGTLLGFLEGVVVVSVFLHVIKIYVPNNLVINDWITHSAVAPYLLNFIQTIQNIFPFLTF